MIKGKLIESIRQAVLRQSPTQDSNKYAHFLTIEQELAKAYNSAVKTFYADDRNLDNYELDYYCKKYELDVDKEYGKYFVTLTATPVDLKRNLGIRTVRPVSTLSNEAGDITFVRTNETELELIKQLEVWCCGKKAFYYKDGNRLVFEYPVNEYALIEKVTVKQVTQFEDFENTDDIPFPLGELAITGNILQLLGIRAIDNINTEAR